MDYNWPTTFIAHYEHLPSGRVLGWHQRMLWTAFAVLQLKLSVVSLGLFGHLFVFQYFLPQNHLLFLTKQEKTEISTAFLQEKEVVQRSSWCSVLYSVHDRHHTSMIKYYLVTLLPILQHFRWWKSLHHKVFLLIISPADNLACPYHILITPC